MTFIPTVSYNKTAEINSVLVNVVTGERSGYSEFMSDGRKNAVTIA